MNSKLPNQPITAQIMFYKMFQLKDFITSDFGCNMLYAKRTKSKNF